MTKDEFYAWDMNDGIIGLAGVDTDFILVKSPGETNAALTTRRAFENFTVSYAHVFKDGCIDRYRSKISDITALTAIPKGE